MLRFFAFFGVFLLHSFEMNPTGVLQGHAWLFELLMIVQRIGRFGLSLFFFLSSFLITTLLLLEQRNTGTIHLKSFYVRRILRIWPLYFLFLTAVFVLGHFWHTLSLPGGALAAYFLLFGNWYLILSPRIPLAITILWSISVEEQFYLLWPSVVRTMTPARIQRFCLGICTLSLLSIYLLARTGSSSEHIWFNSLTEALFFAAGALLALRLGLLQQTPSAQKTGLALIGGLLLWVVAGQVGFRTEAGTSPLLTVVVYILVAAGAAALLWSFLHMPRKLIRPELVYLGRISYGLYVFHGLCIVFAQRILLNRLHWKGGLWLLATLPLTIGIAALSYQFLEKPFLKLKRRFEFVHSRTA